MDSRGRLYVVATPIGNLKDMTFRALEVLERVDFIAAEDTREARKILSHFRLSAGSRILSYFRDNEQARVPGLIALLERGHDLALIVTRGTPGISDPAYLIVREAAARGIPVVPVPGASALTAALSVCGVPADRFLFAGFLPLRPGKRRKALEWLEKGAETAVIYESPHRLLKTLREIETAMGGEREITVCRELTKIFEEIRTGTVSGMIDEFSRRDVRGEFVLVLSRPGRNNLPGAKGRETEP